MTPIISYIGLGSNLADPLQQVTIGLTELTMLPKTSLVSYSKLYRTKPLGPEGQPDYINAVAKLSTQLTSAELLIELKKLEHLHDRVSATRWTARTLDLDILLYGDTTVQSEQLTIPHPELLERDFCLVPLLDIAPDLILPNGQTVDDYMQSFSKTRYVIGVVV